MSDTIYTLQNHGTSKESRTELKVESIDDIAKYASTGIISGEDKQLRIVLVSGRGDQNVNPMEEYHLPSWVYFQLKDEFKKDKGNYSDDEIVRIEIGTINPIDSLLEQARKPQARS